MKIRQLFFPEKLRVETEESQLNDVPGENQILVENRYSLISPGTELAMFTETHIGFPIPEFTYAKYPFRPGYASVGKAVLIGKSVDHISEGDIVFTRGKHASHSIVSANLAQKLPEGLKAEHAPFASLAQIALTSVRLCNIRLGYHVAVFGQGMVGNLAGQLMKQAGARQVIGVDTIPQRLEISAQCGIDTQINAENLDPVAIIRKHTDESGAHVVVEATGSPQVAPAAIRSAAQMGQVILLGSPRGTAEVDLYFDLHRTGVSVIGAHASRQVDAIQYNDPNAHELMLEFIARGRVNVAPLHTHTLPVSEADRAFRGLLDEKETYLGVILDLTNWD